MRKIGIALAIILGLGGCDLTAGPSGKAADAPSSPADTPTRSGAFAHSQTQDLSGYYIPGAQVGPDDFQMMTLFVGQETDFQDWETGKRTATFAPVMLEFQVPGETTERVLPDSYSVADDRIRMSGTSETAGRISFEGRLDAGALSTARRNLGEAEMPALTATVTVDGRTFSGINFGWSGGD